MMAGKAAIIKDIMGRALAVDFAAKRQVDKSTDLIGQYEAFRANLIHDIAVDEFADVYAETIAYGLFAARLHDKNHNSFCRSKALDLLPKTNPFLRELFIYIAGPNLDDRLRRVIDEMCSVFCATSMDKVLSNFGEITARDDPFLHFYEVFLAEYNPAKRKARGVWYTPEPVVNFIVRAVDEVLATEFGLSDGLADTSRITIDWDTGQDAKNGKPATIKKQVHRVQILDPATGTGTFLAEVVKLVAERVKGIAPGQWSKYVEQDLIPRMHGFELLMASYAMCHMKLDMVLTGLGYKPSAAPPRLGVYLTNSLEEGERVEQTLFGLSRAIAEEAKAASDIKRQMPIMCVIGNPPYSGESANKGQWISKLMEVYKQEPGGEKKLQERTSKWINDDYVKFIRFAEHMISREGGGQGVLGFITNHGYLDNPTFRGMRWHLMRSFDRIHVLDLHGNSNKKEVCPDGSPDKNIFDIMQGVAIIIAIKHRCDSKKNRPLAEVRHGELWGERNNKNDALWKGNASSLIRNLLSHRAPEYPFVARKYDVEASYQDGFSVRDLMPVNGVGIVTAHDDFVMGEEEALVKRFENFRCSPRDKSFLHSNFNVREKKGWNILIAHDALIKVDDLKSLVVEYSFRPFDDRKLLYHDQLLWRSVRIIMNNVLDKSNICLHAPRQCSIAWNHAFVSSKISDFNFIGNAGRYGAGNVFPLYLYPTPGTLDQAVRINFDAKLFAKIRKMAGLSNLLATPDGTDGFRHASQKARPDEMKVFDYIYGFLHCPKYRKRYAEFLNIGFPRIPFPSTPQTFAAVSAHGEKLRRLHLMETAAIGDAPFPFKGDGDSKVSKPGFEGGRIWINGSQFFEHVPAIAWGFAIGGYRPAQKWLKDRRGGVLNWNDIRYYQKIIKVLVETDRIMKLIKM